MTSRLRLLVPTLLVSALALRADELRVCVEDRAGLSAPARAGLLRELNALLPEVELLLGSDACHAEASSDVLLSVVDSRPGIPADALGLAFRASSGAILPRLEIFVDPVARLTGAGDWQVLGRALARVAAHELLHYSRQTGDHDAHGLLQSRLTPSELTSEENRPRLIASLHRD